jgi:hypothetical protein
MHISLQLASSYRFGSFSFIAFRLHVWKPGLKLDLVSEGSDENRVKTITDSRDGKRFV